mmetsp:Transcript_12395/g.35443  ORF Transcript_12395/g.35443 Transcript_12395/m.35443 type:complete len:252 (+) Transcript_12395:60-815(+)
MRWEGRPCARLRALPRSRSWPGGGCNGNAGRHHEASRRPSTKTGGRPRSWALAPRAVVGDHSLIMSRPRRSRLRRGLVTTLDMAAALLATAGVRTRPEGVEGCASSSAMRRRTFRYASSSSAWAGDSSSSVVELEELPNLGPADVLLEPADSSERCSCEGVPSYPRVPQQKRSGSNTSEVNGLRSGKFARPSCARTRSSSSSRSSAASFWGALRPTRGAAPVSLGDGAPTGFGFTACTGRPKEAEGAGRRW